MFFLQNCLAIEFEFTHPESVSVEEAFEVEISSSESEVYDVKVFVHKSETETAKSADYISQIDNDGWKSSWNYIKDSFPDEKIFKIKVISDPGERTICVRLRKTGTDSTSLKCDSLKVKESKDEERESEEKNEDQQENEDLERSNGQEKNENNENSSIQKDLSELSAENKKIVEDPIIEDYSPEKLILKNPKKQKEITTKKQESRNFIFYSVIFLLIFLVILLSFKLL